ncbi:hypothetical protein E9993_11370 [Labilibacter sediminis]|nr:hypothetical protein E9993_11370 [Labilibacter sediminis]
MYTNLASTNVTFDFLRGSNEFLTLVLNNINSCILLLNTRMELVSFNDAITSLFPHSTKSNLNYIKCGEAIGCAYQIEETKECGKTSRCFSCEIRMSAISSYLENTPTVNKEITRPFYNEMGKKENKILRYSTRHFTFQGERYVILILELKES